VVRERRAAAGEAIDVRSPYTRQAFRAGVLPREADIPPAEVVGKDEDDIRTPRAWPCVNRASEQYAHQNECRQIFPAHRRFPFFAEIDL
jgi:hypothetical protein